MTSPINRDEDVCEEPNSLSRHRGSVRDHISFGFGAHECLGQNGCRACVSRLRRRTSRSIPRRPSRCCTSYRFLVGRPNRA
ncbi:hypothetical protein AB0M80_02725 [Amycolatopsis sp. NPDC051045]|uniref:hypothetical protein n=1 Tax=Amycolatopsis sp. NPDC051045 TaxID=3156922 RepID=UPI00342AE62B